MELGVFSVSLSVKDIEKSKAFYAELGFERISGPEDYPDMPNEPGQDWIILQNDSTIIGLFEGVFEGNILTFHPDDVRAIQRQLKSAGIEFIEEADESTEGPASCMLTDPDGNMILMDQF